MRALKKKRAPKQSQHIDSEGSWAISYGDMITLLLAFFVLFFSLDPQAEQQEKLQESLVQELNQLKETRQQYHEDTLNIGEQLGKAIDAKTKVDLGAEIYTIGQRLIVEFPGVSFFDSGATELTENGKKALDKFADVYLPFAGKYVLGIRAYTDQQKVRSVAMRRYKDNLELSALRAVSSMRTLEAQGIPLRKMKLSGYGEFQKITEEMVKKYKVKDKLSLARKVVLLIEPEPQYKAESEDAASGEES